MTISEIYQGLKLSLSYFTIAPIPYTHRQKVDYQKALAWMIFWLPFIGAMLFLSTVGLYVAIGSLGYTAAVISAIAYPAMYGFLHTEAIIDVADAIYAKHGGKDPYQVIKEPDVGALGVLWGVSLLIAKTALLAFLIYHSIFGVIFVSMVTSRVLLVFLIGRLSFRSSFVESLQSSLSQTIIYSTIAIWTIASAIYLGLSGVGLMVVGLLLGYGIATTLKQKLGFANGDLLGATLEIIELILFLIGALIWS